MRIVPFSHFSHGGSLPYWYDSRDPRAGAFIEQEVIIDLRKCQFIRPAASLWCAVYPLLAKLKGSKCSIWVPDNMGVCIYLKSLGLFRVLQDKSIEVDDRNVPARDDSQLVLPLTRFDNESQADDLTNKAHELLSESGLVSANLYPQVSETFGELAMNAVQHSESPIGAYGLIQFFESEKGRRFVCCVADGGIGIRRSLEKNPAHRDRIPYDWVAVELATRERVSGTLDHRRGIGLFGVAEEMRKPGRQLIVHSGTGSLQISEEMESTARRTRLFPGTLAFASVPA